MSSDDRDRRKEASSKSSRKDRRSRSRSASSSRRNKDTKSSRNEKSTSDRRRSSRSRERRDRSKEKERDRGSRRDDRRQDDRKRSRSRDRRDRSRERRDNRDKSRERRDEKRDDRDKREDRDRRDDKRDDRDKRPSKRDRSPSPGSSSKRSRTDDKDAAPMDTDKDKGSDSGLSLGPMPSPSPSPEPPQAVVIPTDATLATMLGVTKRKIRIDNDDEGAGDDDIVHVKEEKSSAIPEPEFALPVPKPSDRKEDDEPKMVFGRVLKPVLGKKPLKMSIMKAGLSKPVQSSVKQEPESKSSRPPLPPPSAPLSFPDQRNEVAEAVSRASGSAADKAKAIAAAVNKTISKESKLREEIARKELEKRLKAEKARGKQGSKAAKMEDVDDLDLFMQNLEQNMTREEKAALSGEAEVAARAAADAEEKQRKDKMAKERERYYSDEGTIGDEDLDTTKIVPGWLEKQKKKAGKELKKVDHSQIEYIPLRKSFYIPAPEIKNMTEEEVKMYREKELEQVKIRGKDCPNPVKKWTQCGLPEKVYEVIEREKFSKPFPIQAQALPAIMSGRDVIGIAKTGSGKTMAFVLPMIRHILDQPPLGQGEGPIGLILCPTRELALQLYNEARKFARAVGLNVIPVYGGAGVAEQIAKLKVGAEIVVATPGRMIDILTANSGRVCNLQRVSYVVMDEADRMFDMGFEPQIMRIMDNIRPDRQVVLFSATFPKSVETLAKKILKNPLELLIGGRSVASATISQVVEVRSKSEKFPRLLEILGKWFTPEKNILIFVDTQESVDNLFQNLLEAGYSALALHGGMDQTDRDFTIQDFKSKHRTLMVATSICARGLDVKDLILVINYEVPSHYEDYVHRVGRTGRAGNTGTSITFVEPEQEEYAPYLVKTLNIANLPVPADLKQIADTYKDKVRRGEVKYKDLNGFSGTKGFKFDENEETQRQEQAQASRMGFLIGSGMVEGDIAAAAAEEEKQKSEAGKKAEEEKAADPLMAQIAAARAAAKALSIAKLGGAGGGAEGKMAKEAVNAAKSIQVAMSIKSELTKKMAQDQVAQINASFAKKKDDLAQAVRLAGGTTVGPNGESIQQEDYYYDEIEINDFPQHARWRATHKPTLMDITEMTDASVTTKGTFVAPGKKLPEGETRKLYLLIEATSEWAVSRAKAELQRVLEEAAEEAKPDNIARYSVLAD